MPSVVNSWFTLPSPDNLEEISRAVSALTIDVYKNTLYHIFPFAGAFFNHYQRLKVDPSQEAIMPVQATDKILKEVQDLTDCAGITREVASYVALNYQFSSFGGKCSLQPALLMPYQHMYRSDGKSPFGQEKPGENLKENRWVFSDDETRFLIARELGQIRENSSLLKIAIKVAVIAAMLVIWMSPYGWPLGLTLCIGVLGLYIYSERVVQARADIVGAKILEKKTPGALKIAIATLEKIRQQNIDRRKNSKLARVIITESGNHVLAFLHPFLTTRIERLRQCERNS